MSANNFSVEVINKCKTAGEIKLFNYILKTMDHETFNWYNGKTFRETASKELEVGLSTVSMYLNNLVKYKLLINPVRGVYKVNKEYVDFLKEEK